MMDLSKYNDGGVFSLEFREAEFLDNLMAWFIPTVSHRVKSEHHKSDELVLRIESIQEPIVVSKIKDLKELFDHVSEDIESLLYI